MADRGSVQEQTLCISKVRGLYFPREKSYKELKEFFPPEGLMILICTGLGQTFARLFSVFSPFFLCVRLSQMRGGNRERQECFPRAEQSSCFCSPFWVSRSDFTSLSTTFFHQLTLQNLVMHLIKANQQQRYPLSSAGRYITLSSPD
jgi:hypothetical protein